MPITPVTDRRRDRRGRPTRRFVTSVVAAGAVALSGAGLTACATGDDAVATGPSATSPARVPATAGATEAVAVLARTATQPITSGRLDVTAGDHHVTARFDGEDLQVRLGDPDADPASSAGIDGEALLVDGSAYLHVGGRWIRIPGLEHLPLDGGTLVDASGTVDRIRTALEGSKVTEPGEPMDVDGVAVTRYHASLTGQEAVDLLAGTGAAAQLVDGDERARRIADYALDHTTVDLVGDVDAAGALRRVEVTSRADTSAYPDCSLLSIAGTGLHVVLSGIGEPQGITAPPPDSVGGLTDLDPGEMLDGLAGGLGDLADRFAPGGQPASEPGADGIFAGCPE